MLLSCFKPLGLTIVASFVLQSIAATSIELPHKAYILPEPVPMWPPIWWFWPLITLLFLVILGIVFLGFRRYRRRAYRREALVLLANLNQQDDLSMLQGCHTIIRRCLVSIDSTDASLSSEHLITRLDSVMPKKKRFANLGHWFVDGLYQPEFTLSPIQRQQLLHYTKLWVKKHHA